MRVFTRKKSKKQLYRAEQGSWIRGLNKLVSNTQIKPNELSEAIDIQLVEDGKIQVPRDGQAYYGGTSGSKVTGLFPFYKSDGTRQLVRMSGTTLQKLNSGSWSNISGFTYTTSLDADGVVAYDKLYLVNGEDPLTVYDGTSITSFTEVSAPGAPTPTRTGGSSGSYTFSYKVTAVTAVGETPASSAGSTTLNQADLSDTVYMTVTWSSVTSATGYNIYGRKDGKWYFIAYLEGNSSTTYVDKGQITPVEVFTPPEGNTTGGPKGKYITVYKDSLFILGDPDNPSRMYYSAGGDLITDFTVGSGGGFIDIAKNNGQVGTGMIEFKDRLLMFKENSFYSFSFSTSGLPQLQRESSTIGASNKRGIVAVENDVFCATDRGIFSVGNEAGFAFDVLRTNELSAKVRPIYQSIARDRVANIAAVYATVANKNLVIFSYTPTGGTTNSKAIVYDRERLAWYEWTNIKANCWAIYKDSDRQEHALYGSDSDGYVKEILVGSNDFGSNIEGVVRMRAEDFKEPARYKRLKDIDIILREPTGSITLNIIKDGVNTIRTLALNTISPIVNFGHYVMSTFLLGESTGEGVSSQDSNLLRTLKSLQLEGRSFLLEFRNNGSGSFTILYTKMIAKPRSEGYRKSDDIVSN